LGQWWANSSVSPSDANGIMHVKATNEINELHIITFYQLLREAESIQRISFVFEIQFFFKKNNTD
jgi:hypothetical protein